MTSKQIRAPLPWELDPKSPEEMLAIIHQRYGGKYVKLELGPGKIENPLWASIGLSAKADPEADILADLENGLDFLPDECIDEIYSNQTLEHISNRVTLFNEMWRVLKPGGFCDHCVPHFLSPYAAGDPTHTWPPFTEASFQYFCIDQRTKEPFVLAFSDYGIRCAFVLEKHEVRRGVEIHVILRKPGRKDGEIRPH